MLIYQENKLSITGAIAYFVKNKFKNELIDKKKFKEILKEYKEYLKKKKINYENFDIEELIEKEDNVEDNIVEEVDNVSFKSNNYNTDSDISSSESDGNNKISDADNEDDKVDSDEENKNKNNYKKKEKENNNKGNMTNNKKNSNQNKEYSKKSKNKKYNVCEYKSINFVNKKENILNEFPKDNILKEK